MQHWSTIKINNFSGPLDLLLTMIQAKKMRIEDIDLITITNQYLAYLKEQQILDLEIASEYLAIAAQLVEMKSWAILPKPEISPIPEAYQDFFHRLEDYDAVRTQAQNLRQRYQESRFLKSKAISLSFFQSQIVPLFNSFHITVSELKSIFLRALANSQIGEREGGENDLWMEDSAPITYISSPLISPQEMTSLVIDLLETDNHKTWTWREVENKINPDHNSKNLISLFLVLLDLVHYQIITLNQYEDSLTLQFTLEALKNPHLRERIIQRFDETN